MLKHRGWVRQQSPSLSSWHASCARPGVRAAWVIAVGKFVLLPVSRRGGMKPPGSGVLLVSLQVLYWVYTFVSGLHLDTCRSFIKLSSFKGFVCWKYCCGLSWSVHNVDRLKIKFLIAFSKVTLYWYWVWMSLQCVLYFRLCEILP